jgi:hypothetical protein
VTRNGLHKYKFTESGMGCRFWCIKALEAFEKEEFLANKEQTKYAKDAMQQFHKNSRLPSKITTTIIEGEWYYDIELNGGVEEGVTVPGNGQKGNHFSVVVSFTSQLFCSLRALFPLDRLVSMLIAIGL